MGLPALFFAIPRAPLFAVGLPVVLGVASGLPTSKVVKGPWYNNLRQPAFTPPRVAFPIVWPILYLAMGYASHLAVRSYDNALTPAVRDTALYAIKLYYAQLAMNMSWTPLFFIWKKKGLALVDIVTLTGTVYHLTAVMHDLTDGLSTWFLAPYCAWLSYATYLNAGYWYLNRDVM
ncbi:TspO/MBR-related protein [Clavulina sp. PMI_390]|nr:TspO/MBR-related protein [Clavulina sp. PMI_390]